MIFNCIVVDDDQDATNVFCELLNVIKLDVLATGMNGMDAIKLYKKYHPDLIFVDLKMPQYDGFYAIEKIIDTNPNAKIVIITGDITSSESHLLNLHKVAAVIFKPFDMHKIKKVLGNVLLQ